MWRKRSSGTPPSPPFDVVPRGAHSVQARRPTMADEPAPGPKRRPSPADRRRHNRAGVTAGAVAVGAAAIALIVVLTTGSPPIPPNASRTSLPATSTPPACCTAPPDSSSTTSSTTTSTTIPPSSPTISTTVPVAETVPPSQVLVEVLNGIGARHEALEAARALKARGFLINGTGNAESFDYAENVIEYSSGSLASAETVASYVSGASAVSIDVDAAAQ